MPRPSRRPTILATGTDILHSRGYAATSVDAIAGAADVPKGAFFLHFKSKEAFAVEALRHYYDQWLSAVGPILADPDMPAAHRVMHMVGEIVLETGANQSRGCLIGNLAVELSWQSEDVRAELVNIYRRWQDAFSAVIESGKKSGDIGAHIDPYQAGRLIVDGLQGALVRAKVERTHGAIDDFRQLIASRILA